LRFDDLRDRNYGAKWNQNDPFSVPFLGGVSLSTAKLNLPINYSSL
jgi:hypothetical protein